MFISRKETKKKENLKGFANLYKNLGFFISKKFRLNTNEKKLYSYTVKQRLYIDTSVFGGHFDVEFEAFTIPLFERLNAGEFTLLFSSVTQEELENAPTNVKELMQSIK